MNMGNAYWVPIDDQTHRWKEHVQEMFLDLKRQSVNVREMMAEPLVAEGKITKGVEENHIQIQNNKDIETRRTVLIKFMKPA